MQADAVGELPASVLAHVTPVSSGVTRLAHGLRPTGATGVVHGLDVDLPLVGDAAHVCTVHDLAVFDTPWAFSRTRVVGEQWAMRRAISRADEVIAVSHFTARRLQARFGISAHVTTLAPRSDLTEPTDADVERVRRTHELPDRFVLHVGTIEPRKQVDALARVCRRIGIPLVLAGATARPLDDPTGVTLLGRVPDRDLAPLYRTASATAYVSIYEGFGLPPVEAMACGGAVVATHVGALPDIVGSGFDLIAPGDEARMAAVLEATVFSETEQQRRRRDGLAAVRRLSWDDTARRTIEVYAGLESSFATEWLAA